MNEDRKKCDKYEAFFVFQNEEAFNNHIKECPDCQKEHEKYMKVSSLVKEVAPVYLEKHKKRKMGAIKKLACCFVMFVGTTQRYSPISLTGLWLQPRDMSPSVCYACMYNPET